jgi:hypothetical protein
LRRTGDLSRMMESQSALGDHLLRRGLHARDQLLNLSQI